MTQPQRSLTEYERKSWFLFSLLVPAQGQICCAHVSVLMLSQEILSWLFFFFSYQNQKHNVGLI